MSGSLPGSRVHMTLHRAPPYCGSPIREAAPFGGRSGFYLRSPSFAMSAV
jgi:hypothetical protein